MLLWLAVCLVGIASRAHAESAATFEGAAKLYRKPAPVRLEDIYVPPVEVEAPQAAPEAKGDAFQIQAIDVIGSAPS